MTTIAYKNNVIAYDSRMTQGDRIVDDDAEKCIERDGHYFFLAGSVSDADDFVDMFFGGESREDGSVGFILDPDGNLWQGGVDPDDGFWRVRRDLKKTWVVGSGGDHAITAMDLGASAEKAVEMAMKRDVRTGGKVRCHDISTKA
jgi:20S proteasome alpha/beta subunit